MTRWNGNCRDGTRKMEWLLLGRFGMVPVCPPVSMAFDKLLSKAETFHTRDQTLHFRNLSPTPTEPACARWDLERADKNQVDAIYEPRQGMSDVMAGAHQVLLFV